MNMGRIPGRFELIGAVPRDRLSSGHRAHRFTALLPSAPCPLQSCTGWITYLSDDSVQLQLMARQERLLTFKAGSTRNPETLGRALPYLRHAAGLLSKTAISITGLVFLHAGPGVRSMARARRLGRAGLWMQWTYSWGFCVLRDKPLP
jgi:hypothetical protein